MERFGGNVTAASHQAGMLRSAAPDDADEQRPLVFLSTLGTTEACAQQVRQSLEEKNNEVVVFHTVVKKSKTTSRCAKIFPTR